MMSLPIPLDLWQRLCAFLATHETCQVVIHQHQGRVCKVDLQETVRAGQGDMIHVGDMPVYHLTAQELTKT